MPAIMKSPEQRTLMATRLVERKLQNLLGLQSSGAPEQAMLSRRKELLAIVERLYSRSDGWKGGFGNVRNDYWDSIDLLFFRLSGKSPFFEKLHLEEMDVFDRLVAQKYLKVFRAKPCAEKRMD